MVENTVVLSETIINFTWFMVVTVEGGKVQIQYFDRLHNSRNAAEINELMRREEYRGGFVKKEDRERNIVSVKFVREGKTYKVSNPQHVFSYTPFA